MHRLLLLLVFVLLSAVVTIEVILVGHYSRPLLQITWVILVTIIIVAVILWRISRIHPLRPGRTTRRGRP